MTTLEQYAEAAEWCEDMEAGVRMRAVINNDAQAVSELMSARLAATILRSLASGEKVLCDAEPVAYWCRKHTDGPWYLSANPMPQSDQFVACGSEELPLYAAATQGEP